MLDQSCYRATFCCLNMFISMSFELENKKLSALEPRETSIERKLKPKPRIKSRQNHGNNFHVHTHPHTYIHSHTQREINCFKRSLLCYLSTSSSFVRCLNSWDRNHTTARLSMLLSYIWNYSHALLFDLNSCDDISNVHFLLEVKTTRHTQKVEWSFDEFGWKMKWNFAWGV